MYGIYEKIVWKWFIAPVQKIPYDLRKYFYDIFCWFTAVNLFYSIDSRSTNWSIFRIGWRHIHVFLWLTKLLGWWIDQAPIKTLKGFIKGVLVKEIVKFSLAHVPVYWSNFQPALLFHPTILIHNALLYLLIQKLWKKIWILLEVYQSVVLCKN